MKDGLLLSNGYLLIVTSPAMKHADGLTASVYGEAPTVHLERNHVGGVAHRKIFTLSNRAGAPHFTALDFPIG